MARGAMSNRVKAIYSQMIFERRALLGCTILVGLSVCVWTAAIVTDSWLIARTPEDQVIVVPDVRNVIKVFQGGNSGLFRYCTYGYVNSSYSVRTTYKECAHHDMFPPEMKPTRDSTIKLSNKPEPDKTLINYSRTNVSFAIISMFVMVMGFGFSIYTFRNPRYMFKRLAGGIHFITCACVMVIIQVLLSTKEYGSESTNWIYPRDSEVNYGYSFFLAWFVFCANLFSGCAFMLLSRKRKRDRAPNDELAMADEPTIIGR